MTHCAGVHRLRRHRVHPSSRVALIKNVEYAHQLRVYHTAKYLICYESYILCKLLLLLCFVQFTQDTLQNGWKVISFLSVSFKQGASVRPVLVLISLRMFYFTERINTSLTLFGNVCIKSKNKFFLTCTWRRRVTRTAQATLASWAHPLFKE